MLPTEEAQYPHQSACSTTMKPPAARARFSAFTETVLFFSGAVLAVLIVWSFWTLGPDSAPGPRFPSLLGKKADDGNKTRADLAAGPVHGVEKEQRGNPEGRTFYDDPTLSYELGVKMTGWDEKRKQWLTEHPALARGSQNRVLLVTGSQPGPCRNPIGDHLLLRFFKNKVDYCRIHGYEIYYNNALLNPKMFTYWAKTPVVRAAMVAHPEAEWIWWVDSDAAITDMEFMLPLERYRDHNFVVHGWPHLVYEKKSWVSLNAGVFLIRNCQWSIDFMERWASMGPQTQEYENWGKTLRETFKDKFFPESDDQSGLVYLLLHEKEKWADRIYLESEYYFEGYWVEIVGTLQNITDRYLELEKGDPRLRRRHAEKLAGVYADIREPHLSGAGYGQGSWRRPFVTHFTGCQPCSGDHNSMYSGESCWEGMQRTLNFADDQVLRHYGYVHKDLLGADGVEPLPFDYPVKG